MKRVWVVARRFMQFGANYSRNSQKINQSERVVTRNGQPAPPPFTAALCLVVPAFAVSDLRKDDSLNAKDVENLIDNASYFLCTTIEDANSKQQSIEITDEVISPDSNREFYIIIHIADGQEMIDKKATYFLKRNLPSHGQGIVKKLACLRNLSGLETFNRI